jgi:uncharacterized protein YkwD
MKRKNRFLGLLLILSHLSFSCQNEVPVEDDDSISAYKASIVQLINSYRTAGCNCGSEGYFAPAPPVTWNDILENAAKAHSSDMSTNKFFSHTGSDGSTLGERIKRLGYNWTSCAENIAMGYKNDEQVFNGWINSPGHCRNIMLPDIKEIGLARVGDYWTLLFGAR